MQRLVIDMVYSSLFYNDTPFVPSDAVLVKLRTSFTSTPLDSKIPWWFSQVLMELCVAPVALLAVHQWPLTWNNNNNNNNNNKNLGAL